MWCHKRVTTKTMCIHFDHESLKTRKTIPRFYLESVCGKPVGEGLVCQSCKDAEIAGFKRKSKVNQDEPGFLHGLVGGAYTKESHIYGSEWYLKQEKAYGPLPESILELAMEAQKRARAGRPTKNKDELKVVVAEPKPKVEAKPKASKPRAKPKAKAPAPEEPSAAPVSAPIVPAVTSLPEGSLVETTDEPIPVESVLRIVLRPFTHNDKQFWRDAEREKLYKRTPDGKRGPYVGRWNSQTQSIGADAPDSDAD